MTTFDREMEFNTVSTKEFVKVGKWDFKMRHEFWVVDVISRHY